MKESESTFYFEDSSPLVKDSNSSVEQKLLAFEFVVRRTNVLDEDQGQMSAKQSGTR